MAFYILPKVGLAEVKTIDLRRDAPPEGAILLDYWGARSFHHYFLPTKTGGLQHVQVPQKTPLKKRVVETALKLGLYYEDIEYILKTSKTSVRRRWLMEQE